MNHRYACVTVGSLFVEITPTQPGCSMADAHQYTLVAGGAAANMVFALARLGTPVYFITAVGDDDFGELCGHEMAAFGVDPAGIRPISGQLTPVSFCAIDRRGGKTFRFYRFPGMASPMQMLTAEDFAAVTSCRVFDFSEGSIRDGHLRPLVFQAAATARAAGARVLYAMNLRMNAWGMPDAEIAAIEREATALADIVMLNHEEACFICGEGADLARRVQALGPDVVVITNGGDGDIIVRAGKAECAVSPYRVPVVYDIGAGDTFHAGLVAAMLRHDLSAMTIDDWRHAVRFAAATAAIRVSTSADPHDLPTREAVEGWMERTDCRL